MKVQSAQIFQKRSVYAIVTVSVLEFQIPEVSEIIHTFHKTFLPVPITQHCD